MIRGARPGEALEAIKTSSLADDQEIVDELVRSETLYDIFRILKHLTISRGYKCFNMLRLPTGEESSLNDISIITNWHPDLIGAYDRMGLISHSPVIRAMQQSTKPLVWTMSDLNKGRGDGKDNEVIRLFNEFGLMSGVYFHTADANNQHGTLGLSGDRPDPDHAELIRLSYIANHAFEQATSLLTVKSRNIDILTQRERECIYWTANGKTSGEVAKILGISENTVNHHLSSSAQKLQTVNKAHTVAKAIRQGMVCESDLT